MKKIFIIILVSIIVLLIYIACLDKKTYYLALGDGISLGENSDKSYTDYLYEYIKSNKKLEKYNTSFLDKDQRSIDLLRNIKDNVEENNITLKNALIKADIVTVSIGTNDLISKISLGETNLYVYIDEIMEDIDDLFQTLRSSCKESIIILGYYNFYNLDWLDKYIVYANKKLEKISSKYDFYFADISYTKAYLNDLIYPNQEGYKYIYEVIKEMIDKNKLL